MDTKECSDKKYYAKTDQDQNGKKLCLLILLFEKVNFRYISPLKYKRNDLSFQLK